MRHNWGWLVYHLNILENANDSVSDSYIVHSRSWFLFLSAVAGSRDQWGIALSSDAHLS